MKPWKHITYCCGKCDSEVDMKKGECTFCGAKIKKEKMEREYLKPENLVKLTLSEKAAILKIRVAKLEKMIPNWDAAREIESQLALGEV